MAGTKITAEDKIKQIEEAEKLYLQAIELIEQGNKLIKKGMRGVELCDGKPSVKESWEAYPGMLQVHLFSGIGKLEKLLGIKAEPEKEYDGTVNNGRKALCVGNVKFFQIGSPTQSKYCYK